MNFLKKNINLFVIMKKCLTHLSLRLMLDRIFRGPVEVFSLVNDVKGPKR